MSGSRPRTAVPLAAIAGVKFFSPGSADRDSRCLENIRMNGTRYVHFRD